MSLLLTNMLLGVFQGVRDLKRSQNPSHGIPSLVEILVCSILMSELDSSMKLEKIFRTFQIRILNLLALCGAIALLRRRFWSCGYQGKCSIRIADL